MIEQASRVPDTSPVDEVLDNNALWAGDNEGPEDDQRINPSVDPPTSGCEVVVPPSQADVESAPAASERPPSPTPTQDDPLPDQRMELDESESVSGKRKRPATEADEADDGAKATQQRRLTRSTAHKPAPPRRSERVSNAGKPVPPKATK